MRESEYDLFDLKGKPAHSIIKRRFRRHARHMAKAALRVYWASEWTAGSFEIKPIFPTTRHITGDSIYLGG